ncbi:CPBP family intramembrane metalloprotease [Romeria aff. gracilis LEGE 07310]|uniref:CPBP family intramembrane metalloprotease n=1 Tax=Vasconcelosia minhoensis LEGE 07310 TaxID=915328 RepID=A0A8J7AEW9_9CYAN|nr:type II CAAX endopeptidase family protein [Romeria gracilis]MBE9076168.1 CPBP family intramembrane metalloprotease [Romeria aff. gracilis LEGE 07310]
MTVKRAVLAVLTFIVVLVVGGALISSANQPQVTSRLQLYQTDLLLQATAWDGSDLSEQEADRVKTALLGKDPIETVIEQYEEVRQSAVAGLERSQQQAAMLTALQPARASSDEATQAQSIANQQQALIHRIDLRLGILQAQQQQQQQAIQTWQRLAQENTTATTAQTAAALADLWREPPQVSPGTEALLQNLDGWFRDRALEKLYRVENRPQDLALLTQQEQETAEETLLRLVVIGVMPTLGGLLGAILLVVLIGQRFVQKQKSVLAIAGDRGWTVPWTAETVWQVLIFGFFFIGQIVLPLLLKQTGLSFGTADSRGPALYALVFYLLMASIGLAVLYGSIRPYFPLPEGWFRFRLVAKWPLWGLGGYLVALPLMIGVSLLNQQLWQGQGGSNPLLQTVLEEHDPLALGIFLFTAAIAAPVFEEILFRGFLLPSLTRYMPVWGAIGLSSLIFAAAHLSLSEVLPLTVLGAVLGFVYARSRNLLSSILLHSTWNSVTMIGLFLLGGA